MSLHALAAHVGVLTEYRSDRGELVRVSDDTLAAVLQARGVDIHRAPAAAITSYDEAQRSRRRVVVAWDGHAGDRGDRLPYGYHERERELIISAPRRAAPLDGVHYGVYAPTYALTTARRPDTGDLAALQRLFDWVHTHGGDTVLTLPLLAGFPEQSSPYSPVSRRHWNELFLTLEDLPDGDGPSEPGRAGELIDYPAAFARAHRALDAAVAALSPSRRAELARFCDDHPDVARYARFRAVSDHHGRNWRAWPGSAYRDDQALDRIGLRHAYAQWMLQHQLARIRHHAVSRGGFIGLDLPLGVHPDGFDAWAHAPLFAPGVSTGAPPDLFFPSGQNWGFAPPSPDALVDSGYGYFIDCVRTHLRYASFLRVDHVMQFRRLYWIPNGLAATDGAYVTYPFEHFLAILCLESHLARVPIVGENLGIVPPEVDDALESHGLLGTWVTYSTLDRAASRTRLEHPPSWATASLNTHDMPTLQGYVDGRDLTDRRARGLIATAECDRLLEARTADVAATARLLAAEGALVGTPASTADLRHALLRRLAATASPLVLANLEDLWLEAEPQNVPGTSTERPNWRRPARYRIDELDAHPAIAQALAAARRGGP